MIFHEHNIKLSSIRFQNCSLTHNERNLKYIMLNRVYYIRGTGHPSKTRFFEQELICGTVIFKQYIRYNQLPCHLKVLHIRIT